MIYKIIVSISRLGPVAATGHPDRNDTVRTGAKRKRKITAPRSRFPDKPKRAIIGYVTEFQSDNVPTVWKCLHSAPTEKKTSFFKRIFSFVKR